MAITLKGLAWDHRRCWGPLDASIGAYTAARPGLSIVWERRSLYEFGEGRLEDTVRKYDLITFDHPFVGEVARDGLMLPFDDHLSDADKRARYDRFGLEGLRGVGMHEGVGVDLRDDVGERIQGHGPGK